MEFRQKKSFKVKPLRFEDSSSDNKRLSHGCNHLMYACQQGLTDRIVKELRLKNNAVLQRDRSNKSALHYCSGQRDIIAAASVTVAAPELLESADEDGFTPLHLAVIQGNISLVNLLLASKADVNVLDNEGHSVVHWATVCGEVEALRAVLQAGANVSNPDINGGSPLHYAAQMCGANYEGKSNQSSTNLALEILNILLSHNGSSVNVIDRDGRQPLLWAASAGSAKAILALIKAGARVESSDKDGLTALHCAASRGHIECLDTLINLCSAPTDLIDSNGCTALHYAVTLGHADATSLLLSFDADPNRQDRKGRTPAHCGCAKGQFETVKILGSKNANLWLRNAKGDLPIHEAAASGRKELVLWLLQERPNQINTSSNDGRTLLHIAAVHDNIDMCKLLLDMGADVNSIQRTPRNVVLTPLDCALQKGYRSIAKYLQALGGLPAGKLRLSARRKINKTEPVKPLKFAEKELIVDLKKSKRYVVYVNRSDSDDSLCDVVNHRSRDKEKKKIYKSHRCKYHKRRAASSCSDYTVPPDETDGEMIRSKSSMEMRRKRNNSKHKRDSSISGDCDNEYCNCSHNKKNLKYICNNCCEHKKLTKSFDKLNISINNDNIESLEEKKIKSKCKKNRQRKISHNLIDSSSDLSGDTEISKFSKQTKVKEFKQCRNVTEEDRITHSIDEDKNIVKKIETVTKTEQIEETKETIFTKENDNELSFKKNLTVRDDIANVFLDKPEIELTPSSRPSSRPSSSTTQKRPLSARASSAQRRLQLQQQQNMQIKTDDFHSDIEINIIKDKNDGTYDEDQLQHKQVITEAQVHAIGGAEDITLTNNVLFEHTDDTTKLNNLQINDETNAEEVLTDSTFIFEKQESDVKKTIIEDQTEEKFNQNESVVHEQTTDNMSREQIIAEADMTTMKASEDNLKKVKFETDNLIKSSYELDDRDNEKFQEENNQKDLKNTKKLINEFNNINDNDNKETVQRNSFSIIESDQANDDIELTETRKNSFTILDEDSTLQNNDNNLNNSFTIIEDDQEKNNNKPILAAKSFSAITSDEDDEDDYNENKSEVKHQIETVVGSSVISDGIVKQSDRTSSSTSGERNGRRKRLKKRVKNNIKNVETRSDEEVKSMIEKDTTQQCSKDQDSGFEPSPRAMQSKIPTSGNITRKLAFQTLEDQPGVRRVENRKPGDQNAVNMTTVTQSIQRNIKRYYMERKIFQHLLELKSLQIRSSKSNEAVLVKRAIDDYHKSILALGLETGSTLRRYPFSDYTFKNFETFLYETLKNLQKNGTYNFQNISDVYKEAERRLSPEYSRYEKALHCTTKTHRCLHATHAYTGIPCAAYIPMMNHHTIPKFGFGSYKTTGVGSFYLPKILTRSHNNKGNKVSLELSHGNNKQLIPLPYEKLDKNKKYYVTFTVKGNENLGPIDDKTNEYDIKNNSNN